MKVKELYIFISTGMTFTATFFLSSCFLICQPTYHLSPVSYSNNNFSSMEVIDCSSKMHNGLCLQMHFFSDSSYVLERNRFTIFNGEETAKLSFLYSSVNDTIQASFFDVKSKKKVNNRKRILVKEGYNDIVICSSVRKVFSKPLKMTFLSDNMQTADELFRLYPDDIVFQEPLETAKIYSERRLMNDSIYLNFIGEVYSVKYPDLTRELLFGSKEEWNDSLRYFMLSFDELRGYDVNIKKVVPHIKDTNFSCHIQWYSTKALKTRCLKECYYPHLVFRITGKDGKPVKQIPPLYILPGEYIIKDGKTINITDTIEIYNHLHNNLDKL